MPKSGSRRSFPGGASLEHAELDTQVSVLWGDRGTRQKEIAATVSRFPYLNEGRNDDVDVNEITCCAEE